MKFIILLTLLVAALAVEEIPIVRQDSEVNFDGTFQHSFETGHGIVVDEQGTLKNAGNKDTEAQEITGSFSYTDADGAKYSVNYIANEDGFQPQGEHLPQPPPIPHYIQKALDWIAAHPEPQEPGKKF